ncbi:MAG: hypothetical protein AMXMBFR58_21110 [Phycisphaerae bacterium]
MAGGGLGVSLLKRIRSALRVYGSLGRKGERAAARYLKARGYRVLSRNARVPMGEADLVCLAPDRSTVVIVEVKTRLVQEGAFATIPPEVNVTAHKQRKLAQVARHLARANGWTDRRVRIDVVAVEWGRRGVVVRHHVGEGR